MDSLIKDARDVCFHSVGDLAITLGRPRPDARSTDVLVAVPVVDVVVGVVVEVVVVGVVVEVVVVGVVVELVVLCVVVGWVVVVG